jgi:hypothetical protein
MRSAIHPAFHQSNAATARVATNGALTTVSACSPSLRESPALPGFSSAGTRYPNHTVAWYRTKRATTRHPITANARAGGYPGPDA